MMLRLLIADDDVIVRKWLRLVFQPFAQEFCVVDAVANGQQALDVCRTKAVDIVITDLIMPDMDGMAFIQALRETNLRTQVIILSNYADFSLARKGMSFGAAEYLLKGEITETELLATTRAVGRRLAESAPEETLFMGLTPPQASQLLSGAVSAAGAAFDAEVTRTNGQIWCIVFSQDSETVPPSPGAVCGTAWAARLSALLKEAHLPGIVCVVTDHIAAALVVLTKGPGEAAFFSRQVSQLPASSPALSFSVGAAGPAANAAAAARIFSNACEALRRRFFSGPGSVCFYAPPDTGRERRLYDFREETLKVQELVQSGELNRLKSLVERVCSQRDQYGADDIDRLRRLFNTAAEVLIHHTMVCCPTLHEPQLLDMNPLAEISALPFLDDLQTWLYSLIELCRGYLQRAAGDGSMRRVFAYIEANYMNDLTLNGIAEVAGFSPNYFCNIFKEYTGKSVSTYLTDLRIQHAKQLLTATSKSVSIVAEDVGYESASYFIKVFKDATGVTPNHFRRENR